VHSSLLVFPPTAKRKVHADGGWAQPFLVLSIHGDTLRGHYLYNKLLMAISDPHALHPQHYFIAPVDEVVHAGNFVVFSLKPNF
jgi:hypothetical protein